MPVWNGKLDEIKANLASEKPEIRGRAMQELSLWAQRDPSIHAAALPIFQHYLVNAPDSWTTISCARGIARVGGTEAGRVAWQTLLNRTEHDIVWRAAMAMDQPAYAPDLVELIRRYTDYQIRTAAIRSLGRMRNPVVYDTLIDQLSREDLRANAIEALADLGDPRAIPQIERFLKDRAEAWPEDNHGPMLYVCDIAKMAIDRLSNPKHPDENSAMR